MSVQVETEKLASAQRALAEAKKTTEATRQAFSEAEATFNTAKKALDEVLKSHEALKETFETNQTKMALAKEEAEKAAETEKQAKLKVERCEQSLARVKKHAQEAKELEDKFNKLFDELDKDKSGNVSHNELKKFIASKDHTVRLQLGIGRWREFLDDVDTDGDGLISRDEFLGYFTLRNLDPVRCWGAIYDAIDTNCDGHLTKTELRNYSWNENPYVLRLLGVAGWQELVDQVDSDQSGTIERDEWISFFAKKEISGEYRPAKRQKIEN